MDDGRLPELAGLGAFIEAKMPDWNTPGLAVGIVKDGAVVLAAGYGYRNIEKGLKVTPRTLFANASTSKAFTAAALGMLVEEGKLTWDTPVRHYLPAFNLGDSVAAERLTLRDLLSHRTGYPRHDKVWYHSTLSAAEIVGRLPHLEANYDIRSAWQYNNIMYVAAGQVLEKVAGTTWEEFVRERIFEPLGMRRSNFSVHTSQTDADHAVPYEVDSGKLTAVPFLAVDNIGPAGGINSCVEEMLPWLLLNLNQGKHGTAQIVPERALAEIHKPQCVAQSFVPGIHPEMPLSTYGFGWFIEPYRGYKTVYHVGSLDGFYAYVSFIPEERVGLVVFTNSNPNRFPYVLCYHIYDRLLGLPPIDWNARLLAAAAKVSEEEARQRTAIAARRDAAVPPSCPLAAYVGTYEHPGYGRLVVSAAEQLQILYNGITVALRPNRGDTFEFMGNVKPFRPVMTLTFHPEGGKVDRLSAPFEPAPGASPVIFRRVGQA